MNTRRNLTVGVTVNLEHYENLRLEISGDIENEGEAKELVRFLDHLLGKMGRGDPATAEAVDSYRTRVFSFAPDVPAGNIPDVCHDGVCSLPAEVLEELSPVVPDTAVTGNAGEDAAAAPAIDNSPAHTGQEPAVTVAAPVPPASATGATEDLACEACGTPVTATQQKMSRLFTSRTLCKACMKKP